MLSPQSGSHLHHLRIYTWNDGSLKITVYNEIKVIMLIHTSNTQLSCVYCLHMYVFYLTDECNMLFYRLCKFLRTIYFSKLTTFKVLGYKLQYGASYFASVIDTLCPCKLNKHTWIKSEIKAEDKRPRLGGLRETTHFLYCFPKGIGYLSQVKETFSVVATYLKFPVY